MKTKDEINSEEIEKETEKYLTLGPRDLALAYTSIMYAIFIHMNHANVKDAFALMDASHKQVLDKIKAAYELAKGKLSPKYSSKNVTMN